jgi:aquaporin Z
MSGTAMKSVVAEFVGTFVLVATAGAASGVMAPIAVGSALMVMVYAFGSVSGGILNPAVAVGVWLHGTPQWNVQKLIFFIAAQTAGAVAGAAYAITVTKSPVLLGAGAGFTGYGVFIAEAIYTTMLTLVVLRVACSYTPPDQEYFGLAIGFVIVAGGYAVSHISGAFFNPAATIGFAVVSQQGGWWWLGYIASQLFGAVVATVVNRFLLDPERGGSPPSLLSKFFSELVGTFFLLFAVGCNTLLGSKAGALSIAASLMIMIYALGPISGAHFNPAVTMALVAAGKFPGREKPQMKDRAIEIGCYLGGQVTGASLGATAYALLCGTAFHLQPAPEFLWVHLFISEGLFTFLLAFVVLNVAALSGNTMLAPAGGKARNIHGLAIGFVVVAGGFAVGNISGAHFNPAVSFGVDLAHTIHARSGFFNSIAYATVQLLGGLLAALAFVCVRQGEYKMNTGDDDAPLTQSVSTG